MVGVTLCSGALPAIEPLAPVAVSPKRYIGCVRIGKGMPTTALGSMVAQIRMSIGGPPATTDANGNTTL